MLDERFTVKYISVNTSFVYLPEYRLKRLQLQQTSTLCLRHNDTDLYMSWCSVPGPDTESLCIGATFARHLGIKEGDYVLVTTVDEAPALTSLVVAPKNDQDRVVLEMQADNVQSNLLSQIKVVAKGQPIVAWISKYSHVTLIVDSMTPRFKYGSLENHTEIHVGDPKTISPSSIDNIFSDIFPPGYIPQPSRWALCRIYRAHPLPKLLSAGEPIVPRDAIDESLRSTFCVYVLKNALPNTIKSGVRHDEVLWRIKKVKEEVKTQGGSKIGKIVEPEFVVKLHIMDDSLVSLSRNFEPTKKIEELLTATYHKFDPIFMSHDLLDNLRLKIGGRITVEPIDDNITPNKIESIEIYPHESFVVADTFVNYVKRNTRYAKMLLNTGANVVLENGVRCLVKLGPEGCEYGLVNEETLKRIEVRISDAASIEETTRGRETEKTEDEIIEGIFLKESAREVLKPLLNDALNALKLSLGLFMIDNIKYDRDNVLIKGPTGSGKTLVCKLITESLVESPWFVHVSHVDCLSLKGKKWDIVQKLMVTEITNAIYYQPSIIVLDDIDEITSASANTDENTPDSMNAARVTDVIYNTITVYQRKHYVSVIATCTDLAKVGQKLREARGLHFFRTSLTIKPLEKEDRIKILRSSLEDKLQLASVTNVEDEKIDWKHYAEKTEGWVIQDLVVLADKAAFAAWKRHVKDSSPGSPKLLDSDLRDTLEHCSPAALRGVELYRGEGYSWTDIGGLRAVKQTLVEILHWPLKYPGIFKNAPIKLQSGVLLYGMPGTGKTMLAGAIAKECGLNFISVKGPELLSKYIGASEEAVRNIFEKAHRAKPCVLFFDEFDSLAPRRGHDSTGVTDRVVNQLLTHLDGIEDRDGVAVVAASSRPDLLDPALLRPGRLDKALLCPMPDEPERVEILRSLCGTQGWDVDELDLDIIARMTNGFTGADLNAILIQAKLDVMEEAMDSASIETKEDCAEAKVTKDYLLKAAKVTKPSLSALEKQKYSRIYAKFTKSEKPNVDEMKSQRATLA